MAIITEQESVVIIEHQAANRVVQVVQTTQETIIQTAPGPVVIQPNLKEVPGRMRCPYCQKNIVTVTKSIDGLFTWTVSGVLFIFLLWPLCLLPFCMSSCKDVEHSCPYCHNVIHIYTRM